MNVRDHLRVCGADTSGISETYASLGSSPRVRSRRNVEQRLEAFDGIISACAEQTNTIAARAIGRRDHLRVCGADNARATDSGNHTGSSPRVRSRHHWPHSTRPTTRIISACAEQTRSCRLTGWAARDHLRVCGADGKTYIEDTAATGSSPRVRSRQCSQCGVFRLAGIISACAEQTPRRFHPCGGGWDHLRVCGADVAILVALAYI